MTDFVEIDAFGYYVGAAFFADGIEQNIKPAIEADLSSPAGMRKPKWINGTWIDEEEEQLKSDIASNNVKGIEDAIGIHIDATAKSRGYDSTASCISYIGDTNAQWDAEAVAFKSWRSQCWEYAIAEQAKVDSGLRTLPTPEEAILELPPMVWPI